MASRFYGINKGGMAPKDITESGSTTSSGLEVQIDLTKVTSKLDAIQMLQAIENYLATVETGPIA